MFLNSLNEQQKNLFIELAIKAAEANGRVDVEEKNMLKAFAIEMSVSPKYSTDDETDYIVKKLGEISTQQELKIILFEILGIIVSDGEFDEQEKKFIKGIVEQYGMDYSSVEKMVTLIQEYAALYQRIADTIFEK
jgi:hypothetical protein